MYAEDSGDFGGGEIVGGASGLSKISYINVGTLSKMRAYEHYPKR